MSRTRHLALVVVCMIVALCVVSVGAEVQGGTDYDVQSSDWNGLQELVRLAQRVDVDLRPSNALDWSQIRRGDGLLILYPRSNVEVADLSGFLEDGGRLAVMDDFGEGGALFRWFQVTRSEDVSGAHPRSTAIPGLLVAFRRSEHPLSEGVDQLITNEPVTVHHARLSPVFSLTNDDRSGVVLAGQVGRGRLVVSGDPSVLINTMMRFGGNRQFARNLLMYLAGHAGGRVHLVHSGFVTRGVYHGRHAQGPVREIVQSINEALERLGRLGGSPLGARVLALLVAAAAALFLGMRVWGSRPSDRFGPTAPTGAVAAVAEKVAIFSAPGANLLYPTLIAKRHFERVLLRAVGLKPPTDVGAVLARVQGRLDSERQNELRAILVDLDALATPSHEGGPSRIAPRRFLSLWRRINAMLTTLGDA